MNRKLSETDRTDIANMQGVLSAKEVAELYDISEKTVHRVWNEMSSRVYTRDYTGGVQMDFSTDKLLEVAIEHYNYVIDARNRYRAKAIANPTNCAWGNLELKFTQESDSLLGMIGKWKAIDKKIGKEEESGPSFCVVYDLETKKVPDIVSKKGYFKEGEDDERLLSNKGWFE